MIVPDALSQRLREEVEGRGTGGGGEGSTGERVERENDVDGTLARLTSSCLSLAFDLVYLLVFVTQQLMSVVSSIH